jgi:sec-independent protein translocase protein TatB
MKIFNLGISEIILIVILALIIMGPGNMVKTAREIGAFIRKVTKSPYWKEIWATKRELTEIPRILAKEADLDNTLKDLDKETRGLQSSVASTMSDFIKEVEEPLKEVDKELKEQPVIAVSVPVPSDEKSEQKADADKSAETTDKDKTEAAPTAEEDQS